MVFAFSAMLNRMSAATAQIFFYVYALAMGASLSSIFLVFTGASIAQVFLITAIAFAGLTAYDTQNIKGIYVAHAAQGDAEWLGKAAVMGALQLYLDFINLFMFLLQFFGQQRE